MQFAIMSERRDHQWYADVRGVPGTGSLGPTKNDAIAGAVRKLAEKFETRELVASIDMLIVEASERDHIEAPHHGRKPFTGADMLALLDRLPHPDPGWADAVEEASRNQPLTSGKSPWDS